MPTFEKWTSKCGCAAVLEGRAFVGIEKEPEYFEIAKRRIAHALAEVDSDMLSGVI